MLKSRLYELELEKQKASKDGGEKTDNGWGIKSDLMFFNHIKSK